MAFALPSIFVLDPNDPYASPRLNLKLVFIGLGIFVAFIAAAVTFLLLSSTGTGTEGTYFRLVAQQDFLSTVISNNQSKITNDDLLKANVDASALFTSDSTTLDNLLQQLYGVTAVPATYTAASSASSVDAQLQTAATTGSYNSVYRQMLLQKISSLQSLSAALLNKTHNPSLHQALAKYASDLRVVHDELTAIRL